MVCKALSCAGVPQAQKRRYSETEDERILAAADSGIWGAVAAVARELGRAQGSVSNRLMWLRQERHAEPKRRPMPPAFVPLARPAWFNEGDVSARLMAGR
jgi:hypothetical protein